MLEAEPRIRVVGRASNGAMALTELDRVEVDVVVLDLEMPVMDGMTALPLMLKKHPGLKVVVASTLSRRNARISLEALQQGAADYLPKPETGTLVNAADFARELLEKVSALGGTARCSTSAVALAPRRAATVRPAVIAIGGSTGAPPVLLQLAAELKGVGQALLITQHMPATFTALLAEQMERAGNRPFAEAREGEPILAGRGYDAPGGWHMTVGRSGATPVIRLNQDPPEHFCRPAVDPMLRSLDEVFGPRALAVILTGMGSDGAEGCRAIAAAGGRIIVQDEATSAVWGMPGAAARTGLAEAVLPRDQLSTFIRQAAQ